MAPMVRVLVTGPSSDRLQALAGAVQQSGDLALAALASPEHAEAVIDRIQPDAVLMTYEPGTAEGPRIVRRISTCARVVLFGISQDAAAADGLLAGAQAVVQSDASVEEIVDMIRTDAGEGVRCPDCVAYELFDRLCQLRSSRTAGHCLVQTDLSFQEVSILRLLGAGLSNKQIANYSHLSVHTVKNYVHRILKRLGLQNRLQAADYFQAVSGGAG
jgi:two-component system response regulator DevR